MANITVREQVLQQLRGKTVLITGGANGIGKTASKLFHEYGANVAIGDLDDRGGAALAAEFGKTGLYMNADVTSWTSLCNLFSATAAKFGSIDVVCANAGIPEKSGFLLEDELDSDGELKEPSFKLIDVNVNGVARTTKLALHYFAKNKVPGGSLVMTGSAASYFGASPIMVYGMAKHALVGLMRSVASVAKPLNVRVNLVAPWMTETDFSNEVRELWGDMPINTQHEVGIALLVAAADDSLHGRGLFVAKKIVDVELPLRQLQSQWLGEDTSDLFDRGRVRLAGGMGFPTEHYMD